ncbi:GTPase family protein [Providencia alcalifaciens]|uniref:GTPase family protein n=1 Tax=Providencia alcalifaciens TaxID=126385 RepID=UPI003D9945E7
MKQLEAHLSFLPERVKQRFFSEFHTLVNYSPTIGLMGKTGAGKSSLINALFQSPLSAVSDVSGCTRHAQRFSMVIKQQTLTFIDLPGVGESVEYDREYHALYRDLLPELDIIIWVLKADDRAWSADEQCYRFLTEQCGYERSRFLFVLNQADKIEPCREWDEHRHQPSLNQRMNLNAKLDSVVAHFEPVYPVIAVSSSEQYQLTLLAEQLMQALPAKASSGVARQLASRYRSEKVDTTARNDFGLCIGDMIESLIQVIPLPSVVKSALTSVKNTVVSLAQSLWSFFF